MPKMVKAYKGKHYSVNCKYNDSVDIKCGGPQFLGFDFYIDPEKPEEKVISHIKRELKKNKLPLISVTAGRIHLVSKLWTRKAIDDCIKNMTI